MPIANGRWMQDGRRWVHRPSSTATTFFEMAPAPRNAPAPTTPPRPSAAMANAPAESPPAPPPAPVPARRYATRNAPQGDSLGIQREALIYDEMVDELTDSSPSEFPRQPVVRTDPPLTAWVDDVIAGRVPIPSAAPSMRDAAQEYLEASRRLDESMPIARAITARANRTAQQIEDEGVQFLRDQTRSLLTDAQLREVLRANGNDPLASVLEITGTIDQEWRQGNPRGRHPLAPYGSLAATASATSEAIRRAAREATHAVAFAATAAMSEGSDSRGSPPPLPSGVVLVRTNNGPAGLRTQPEADFYWNGQPVFSRRQLRFPAPLVPNPVPKPVSAMHNLVCKYIDHVNAKEVPDSDKAPNEFSCPLSLHAMRDPVWCSDRQRYERTHIEAWRQSSSFNGTSPLTRAELSLVQTECSTLVNEMAMWTCANLGLEAGDYDALNATLKTWFEEEPPEPEPPKSDPLEPEPEPEFQLSGAETEALRPIVRAQVGSGIADDEIDRVLAINNGDLHSSILRLRGLARARWVGDANAGPPGSDVVNLIPENLLPPWIDGALNVLPYERNNTSHVWWYHGMRVRPPAWREESVPPPDTRRVPMSPAVVDGISAVSRDIDAINITVSRSHGAVYRRGDRAEPWAVEMPRLLVRLRDILSRNEAIMTALRALTTMNVEQVAVALDVETPRQQELRRAASNSQDSVDERDETDANEMQEVARQMLYVANMDHNRLTHAVERIEEVESDLVNSDDTPGMASIAQFMSVFPASTVTSLAVYVALWRVRDDVNLVELHEALATTVGHQNAELIDMERIFNMDPERAARLPNTRATGAQGSLFAALLSQAEADVERIERERIDAMEEVD